MPRPSPKHSKSPELVALGFAIRTLRAARGLSQEELALHADLDRAYVGGIERGEHNITVMSLLKIARAIDTPLSKLLKYGGL